MHLWRHIRSVLIVMAALAAVANAEWAFSLGAEEGIYRYLFIGEALFAFIMIPACVVAWADMRRWRNTGGAIAVLFLFGFFVVAVAFGAAQWLMAHTSWGM
jgi:hypothetical protein